jgi:hypothetical protein
VAGGQGRTVVDRHRRNQEWVDAVRNAKVPDEYAHLDAELK